MGPKGLATFFTVAVLLAAAGPARASFPGNNGLLGYGYSYEDGGINQEDGSEVTFSGGGNRVIAPFEKARRDLRRCSFGSDTPTTGNCDGTGPISFSPDGKRLVLAGGDGLAVMRPDGTHFRHLPTAPLQVIGKPVFSPGGGRVLFTRSSDRDGAFHFDLYVVDLDGRHLRLVARDARSPAWSATGRIAFSRGAVCVLGRRDHRVRRVAPEGSADPSWSPGGGHLAFSYRRHIYVAGGDGSRRRLLLRQKPFYGASTPAWSPGGGLVAYADGTVVQIADLRGHLLRSYDQSGAEGDFLNGLDWQAVPRK
jgi:hypothetical protein